MSGYFKNIEVERIIEPLIKLKIDIFFNILQHLTAIDSS